MPARGQSGYAADVEGLAQFSRALARIGDGHLRDGVKQANFKIADKLVDFAKSNASGMNRQQTKAAESLRATNTANYAAIRLGSARTPYALGAEFGAKKRTHRGRIARGFRPWRGNQWSGWAGGPGYFLHPAIREHAPELLDEYMQEIDRITQEAFPE
jgi:hypothetical protein